VNVNDENIGLMLAGLDQGLESAGRGFDLEAHPGTSVGDSPQHTGVVVGNQDLRSQLVCFEFVHDAPPTPASGRPFLHEGSHRQRELRPGNTDLAPAMSGPAHDIEQNSGA
jgi:hypothetical protein